MRFFQLINGRMVSEDGAHSHPSEWVLRADAEREIKKGHEAVSMCLSRDDEIRRLGANASALRDLLRDEYNRGHRLDSPWDCVESECPGFKNPMRKSCGCYQDAAKAHTAKVLKEINQS